MSYFLVMIGGALGSLARHILTTSALDLQNRNDPRVLPKARMETPPGVENLLAAIAEEEAVRNAYAELMGLVRALMPRPMKGNTASNASAVSSWGDTMSRGDSIFASAVPAFT